MNDPTAELANFWLTFSLELTLTTPSAQQAARI